MAAPDQQWDLGTEALNGADGDTARAAGTKYNAHEHQTADVQAAIDGAASPSGANVFATMADVGGGGGLTADETDAIQGAAAPSAANVFATMADIPADELTSNELQAIQNANAPGPSNEFATMLDVPTATELAAIQGAAAPSGANVFATMADVGGGYSLDPSDWVSISGVEGFGTGTALTTATYNDLNINDGQQALLSHAQFGSAGLRSRAQVAVGTWQGIDLGNFPLNTDGVIAVRIKPYASGIDHDVSRVCGWALQVWDGTDTAADNSISAGISANSTINGNGWFRKSSEVGRGSSAGTLQTYGPHKGVDAVDFAITRNGTNGNIVWWAGYKGAWTQLDSQAAWSTAEIKVALVMRSSTASFAVGCDVTHILPGGALASTEPPLVT